MENMNQVVRVYISIRDERDAKVAKHKEEIKQLNEQLEKLEAVMLAKMNQEGLDGLPTEHGTAFKVTKSSASVVDMEAMLEYIREQQAWHLLEKRVSTVGIRELLDEGQPLPPGVNWFTKVDVNVRRASER